MAGTVTVKSLPPAGAIVATDEASNTSLSTRSDSKTFSPPPSLARKSRCASRPGRITRTSRTRKWVLTSSSRLVSLPPSASACVNVASNSMNLPCSVVVMNHRATPAVLGAMSPKSTSRLVVAVSPFTSLPMMVKAMSSPCSFSMIRGCPDSIFSLFAAPSPWFATRTPSVNGTGGSTTVVYGLSECTCSGRK